MRLNLLQLRRRAWVSIHASVKDATVRELIYCLAMGFNPRICKRCDEELRTLKAGI